MLRDFDARVAKSLQPEKHLIIPDYPRLRLTATSKTKTWVYRYKSPIDGRMRQTAIGHWPAMLFPAVYKQFAMFSRIGQNRSLMMPAKFSIIKFGEWRLFRKQIHIMTASLGR